MKEKKLIEVAEPMQELAKITCCALNIPFGVISLPKSSPVYYTTTSWQPANTIHLKPTEDNKVTEGYFMENRDWKEIPFRYVLVRKSGPICLHLFEEKSRVLSENEEKTINSVIQQLNYLEKKQHILRYQEIQIQHSEKFLTKISAHASGVLFKISESDRHPFVWDFVSDGIKHIHPELQPEDLSSQPELLLEKMYEEDRNKFLAGLEISRRDEQEFHHIFSIRDPEQNLKWYSMRALPERNQDSLTEWFGTIQDITESRDYIDTLEQILFDIAHTIRRPVSTMMGLTNLIEDKKISPDEIEGIAKYLKIVALEMDDYTKKLSEAYLKRKLKILSQNTNHPFDSN